ncbi:OmpW/AlkL family protein [Salinicola aestuarinus]|uniref:OmpW/AlkL family protein n=1 Tax=Salinicola aestuarinus TaxID=1949082 RepID=UPI0013004A74|nr:OmpW family outer membrane protein [Salinicola aestuarinus]
MPRRDALFNRQKRRTAQRPLLASLLALSLLSSTAEASPDLRQGDWLLRGTVMRTEPHRVRSTISGVGGKVEIDDRVMPGAELTYFLSDRWALALSGGVSRSRYRVSGSTLGDFDVGEIETYAAALALQYRFPPVGGLHPYLGAGVHYARERNVDPAEGIPDFSVEPVAGHLFEMGADYSIGGNWFVNASVRQYVIPTYRFESQGFNSEVKLDIWTVGAGMGYRF